MSAAACAVVAARTASGGARTSGLSGTTGGAALGARPLRLDRRTRHRPVGAEHAAVARLRPQRRAALRARIENPAGIRRHRLRFRRCAVRAGDDRFKDHRSLPKACRGSAHVHCRMATSLDGLRVCHFYVAFFAFARICFSRLSVGDRQSPLIYGSPPRRCVVFPSVHYFLDDYCIRLKLLPPSAPTIKEGCRPSDTPDLPQGNRCPS